MNTKSTVTMKEARRAKRWRFNAIGNLQPETLGRFLDAFQAGYLSDAAGIWEQLEQRDDLLRGVISKRKKSVARYGWTILPKPDLTPEEASMAKQHSEALEFFYKNVECENSVDLTERGGFKLLTRQMMDAVGKRFAVHEMVWRAEQEAGVSNRHLVTARFRFVPLGFFENTTGSLRFLESESAMEGRPLEPGAWMVTVGEGLMIASSAAWMTKSIALNDWLKCSERNGTPGLRGTSAAARGSAEWVEMEKALADLQEGKAIVHATSEDVQVVDFMANGNIPYPKLVERIDRMLATLWRGADLSTLSRDRGYGASLQEKETCALEEDDAEMLTETLNRYVDEWVIRYVFGEGARPLANVKVLVSPRECTTGDLQIDEFLLRHGAPLAIEETMSRYGRALPKPGEKVLIGGGASANQQSAGQRAKSGSDNLKASVPESSQNLGMIHPMGNSGSGNGDSVSFRESLASNGMINTEITEGTETTEGNGQRSKTKNQACDGSGRGDETSESLLTSTATRGDGPSNGKNNRSLLPSAATRDASLTSLASVQNSSPLCSPCPPSTLCDIPNSSFNLEQREWVQLSPYGDFPHARGLQRVDRAVAEALVAQFNSWRARIGRLFGGLPVYVGHPDVPSASELADRKAYGWIVELEAREDGLFGCMKWSDAGTDLLRNAHFKYLSPYWEAREITGEAGRKIYTPVALLSVGLTNQPNIPVRPLANEVEDEGNDQRPKTKDQPEDSSCDRSSRREEAQFEDRLVESAEHGRSDAQESLLTSTATKGGGPAGAQTSDRSGRGNETLAVAGENIERIKNSEITEGRKGLVTSTSTALILPAMHTVSRTGSLNQRRGELVRLQNRRDRLQEAVLAKVKLGLAYDDAWESVKREHPHWFGGE